MLMLLFKDRIYIYLIMALFHFITSYIWIVIAYIYDYLF